MKESLAPGQTLGSYRILSPWDSGAANDHYLAESVESGAKVLLRPLPAPPEQHRERIERSAAAAAAIEHPRVARILEIGEADGRRFLVSEGAEGRSLAARMRKGVAPPREVLATAISLAEALDKVHEAGIVHGDIRPANVILTDAGELHLTGFGSSSRVMLEESGGRLVEYLSPEEARGQAPDAQSDIYSLGVLLYELAVGRRPFRARTAEETIAQILEAEPSRVNRWHPNTPEPLSSAIHKCLAKDPAQRYASVAELLADLRALEAAKHPRRGRRALIVAAALVMLAAVLAGAYWFLAGDRSRPPRSFALVDFAAGSGSGVREHLGLGIAEGIISNLSRLRFGRVLSSGTLARSRGSREIPALAQEFNVEALVRGRLTERSGGEITLEIEVLDGVTGRRRWGDSYRAKPEQWHALPLQATAGLARWARLPLGAEARAAMSRRYSRRPEALRLYFEGLTLRNKRGLSDLRGAIERFRKAAAADPKFGLASAALAEALAHPGLSPSEVGDQAAAAALQALSADDRLPEAHLALALARFLRDWNWSDAEREFRAAIQLNPGYVTAHQRYAEFLAATSRLSGARSALQEAEQRDPRHLESLWTSSRLSYFGRRYDEALAITRRLLETAPAFDAGYAVQGASLVGKNQASEAVAIVSRAGVLVPDALAAPDLLVMLGCAYASAGHAAGFAQMIEQLNAMSGQRYVSPYHYAMAHACAGNRDEAFRQLGRALEERSPQAVYLNVEPAFDAIRADVRFAPLVEKAGLGLTQRTAPADRAPPRKLAPPPR